MKLKELIDPVVVDLVVSVCLFVSVLQFVNKQLLCCMRQALKVSQKTDV